MVTQVTSYRRHCLKSLLPVLLNNYRPHICTSLHYFTNFRIDVLIQRSNVLMNFSLRLVVHGGKRFAVIYHWDVVTERSYDLPCFHLRYSLPFVAPVVCIDGAVFTNVILRLVPL